MDLVGRAVRKPFDGFGTFAGFVESYNPFAGYFRVLYEDGDSEDLDFHELTKILAPNADTSPTAAIPTKRPRIADPATGMLADQASAAIYPNSGQDCASLKEQVSLAAESSLFDSHIDSNSSFGCETIRPVKRQRMSDAPQEARTEAITTGSVRQVRSPVVFNFNIDPIRYGSIMQDMDAAAAIADRPSPVLPDIRPVLPPSSNDLDLDGLPVLDLFSVYSSLRSFSRLLLLSPFRLETFVAALKCRHVNNLLDSVHFSILYALKRHLDDLSREGSWSATCCLRNLNWELLDTATWPVHLTEYLLIRGVEMKSGTKISHLKLLDDDYYKQPAVVKLEILRCLCDDVIEVEAIRAELSRRMMNFDLNSDYNHIMDADKKVKDFMEANLGISTPDKDVLEEPVDGNIDECCLCRMEGNLICCDGCPAAFHSRCVGVSKDILPEGEWYCPECLMEKADGLGRLSKAFRGAEILGIDPHGRLYFGSCGYLLVSDSCETDDSFHYYNKNDMGAVIEALTEANASYNVIVKAISMYCRIRSGAYPITGYTCHGIHHVPEDVKVFSKLQSSSEQDNDAVGRMEGATEEYHCSTVNFCPNSPDLLTLNSASVNQVGGLRHPDVFSEITVKMTEAASEKIDIDCSVDFSGSLEKVNSPEPADLAIVLEKNSHSPASGHMSLLTNTRKNDASNEQSDPQDPAGYVNCYTFAPLASSVGEELTKAKFDNNDKKTIKSSEDIKSAQLKAISKRSVRSCWYTSQNLFIDAQEEKCGWCSSCQASCDDKCLVKIAGDKHLEDMKNQLVKLRSGKNSGYLISSMHHILLIEERLRSLLSGPWKSPDYSKCWRKAVMEASDVASLKHRLLVLESNLRHVVLSAEWLKPVDGAHAFGSVAHLWTDSAQISSNHGGNRRQAKKSVSSAGLYFNSSASKSGIDWWRGGRQSRQVFQWNMLPQALTCKGARQGGCKKIQNLFYPDGSELAKRSKCVAWRAAVQITKSVAQLIYQIKDFESNIRWTELSTTELFPRMGKEHKKLTKTLKKVIIRKKCADGMSLKYLLDFGKREILPAIVTKHGVMLEESSDGRKKYWLNETHVPLTLLKGFEERQLASLLKKSDSGLLSKKRGKHEKKTIKRLKGLSYLLSRGPQSQLCVQCNKAVLVREALNCQICDGFFHRKHFKSPKGTVTTNYTCCNCKDKGGVKLKAQGQRALRERRKTYKAQELQKLPKKRKHVLKAKELKKLPKKRKHVLEGKELQKLSKNQKSVLNGKDLELPKKENHVLIGKKKSNRSKRGKQHTYKKGKSKKSSSTVTWRKRRTVTHHSYWLNGLLWTPKIAHELGRDFRDRKVVLPFQHIEDHLQQPVCCLCHEDYNPEVIYIRCDCCEDWFHGDVFFLTPGNINSLIGFKCHKCLMKNMPSCPFSKNTAAIETQLKAEPDTRGGNIDVEHQNIKEKLQTGLPETYLPLGEVKNPIVGEQSEDNLTRSNEALTLYGRARPANGHISRQSYQYSEAEVASLKHGNGVELVASQKVEESIEIPMLLVTGKMSEITESNSQDILSTPQFVDISGGRS